MPQSVSCVLIHVVFSTKGRQPWLRRELLPEVQAYLAAQLNRSEHACVRVGGDVDHVHVALFLARTESVAKVVERLKVSSSKWIKTKGMGLGRFQWQRGYAVFSVGLRDRAALVRYIDEQAEHHAKRDFQGEMRAMFRAYGVEFDEGYVWD